MNQFAGQGPPTDEETRWHQNNQAVVDLHERAIVHLLGDDEYVALQMWRDALRSIESFTQGFFPDAGSLVTGATMTETASISNNHGERGVAVADARNDRTDLRLPKRHGSSQNVHFIKAKPCWRGDTLSKSGERYPRRNRHLPRRVVTPSSGIRSGFQHLLDESRTFYELAYSAVSHAELLCLSQIWKSPQETFWTTLVH
jgi:hypothetical protein